MSIQEFMINIGKDDGTPGDRKLRTNFNISFSRELWGINDKGFKIPFMGGDIIYYIEKIDDKRFKVIAVGKVKYESPKNIEVGWEEEEHYNKLIHHYRLINVKDLNIEVEKSCGFNKHKKPERYDETRNDYTWCINGETISKTHLNVILNYELH